MDKKIYCFQLFLLLTCVVNNKDLIADQPNVVHSTARATLPTHRVVLELNQSSFTARQILLYTLIKDGIDPKNKIHFPSPDNWTVLRMAFCNDMIVEIESNRLGAFTPNAKTLLMVSGAVSERTLNDKKYAEEISKLAPSSQEIQDLIKNIFKIEAYKRSKSENLQKMTDKKFASGPKQDFSEQDWFRKTKSDTVVRWLDGADKFRPF
jgi:hypothetical protein